MKFLCVLLLFISSGVFAQSGYYYFASHGSLKDTNQPRTQVYVSYVFYADNSPVCTEVYLFFDVNLPQFDYYLRPGSGCNLKGPFATQEEAEKARDRHADRLRNWQHQNYRVNNIIYKVNKKDDETSSSGSRPD